MRNKLFRFKIRLKMLWKVLTSRNVIMLYSIKESIVDNEPARGFKIALATEYTLKSDALFCLAAAKFLNGENEEK